MSKIRKPDFTPIRVLSV